MEEEKKVTDNSTDDELLDPNDFEETEVNEDESVEVEEEKEETKDKNAYFAQKRREQEAKAREKSNAEIIEKERNDAYLKGKLDATKVNKFTDEPIEDEYDLEIYELQLELDKQGKDPINDLGAELAKRNRSKNQVEKQKLEKENAQKAQMQKDIGEFVKAYPKVDTKQLSQDENFTKFAEGKWGRWSMTEIYEAYLDKQKISTNESTSKEVKENAEKLSKQFNKMPSSNSTSTSERSTAEMTYEEYEAYFNKKYK